MLDRNNSLMKFLITGLQIYEARGPFDTDTGKKSAILSHTALFQNKFIILLPFGLPVDNNTF
jgi:hypothetical protein